MQTKRLHYSSLLKESLNYDCSTWDLKMDSGNYPLMVGQKVKKYYNESKTNKKIGDYEWVVELFLETFSPKFKECYEFIVLIAEPKSRQEFIQSFEINSASLFASVTLGYNSKKILKTLQEYNKFTEMPV